MIFNHKTIANKFNKLATGEIKRLIVNMPPRHTKSEFGSYLLPAWMVGRNPKLKIIQSKICNIVLCPSVLRGGFIKQTVCRVLKFV